jgi:hypothetical protein
MILGVIVMKGITNNKPFKSFFTCNPYITHYTQIPSSPLAKLETKDMKQFARPH